jgi:hypothetical protein
MEVQPYYASQWRFTLATGWLLPGNLGGIADRLLLAYSVEKLQNAFIPNSCEGALQSTIRPKNRPRVD